MNAGGVLVLGFANLVADAISMGFGDLVSASSERDVITEERRVTEWDVMNHRNNEQRELVRHYQALGMDYNDATMVCMRKYTIWISLGKTCNKNFTKVISTLFQMFIYLRLVWGKQLNQTCTYRINPYYIIAYV